jgi:hypothetical protein
MKVDQEYVVDGNDKRKCPYCNAVESGQLRIISHYFNCKNPYKNKRRGGRKNRKPTKKNRRRTRRSSKKNRRN